ncbi:MAG: peptidoglycan editing factor PgeF [Pseudohongiellaceae bacterium]
MSHDRPSVVRPDWPAPAHVTALVTTRHGGQSRPPYAGFNLAHHVGDDAGAVESNRQVLQSMIGGVPISWVRQVHGTRMVEADDVMVTAPPEADAVRIRSGGAAAVMTADCLPVFLADKTGQEAVVVHAGWRGLVAGIIESSIARLDCRPIELMAWLGPAIGPCHFEVGDEVRTAFMEADAGDCGRAFTPTGQPGQWMADLYELARIRLHRAGVDDVYGGGLCTFCDGSRFYSFRRDGTTGRMAALICLNK